MPISSRETDMLIQAINSSATACTHLAHHEQHLLFEHRAIVPKMHHFYFKFAFPYIIRIYHFIPSQTLNVIQTFAQILLLINLFDHHIRLRTYF